MDQNLSLFERYRAMFSLRDKATDEAVLALCDCFDDDSALFKHEVAFVLGQMGRRKAAPRLRQVLSDKNENIMVRHEAAEALGAIAGDDDDDGDDDAVDGAQNGSSRGDDETLALLREHARDEEAVVAHSALVALDIADYNQSDDFQYCETEESLSRNAQ